jgi:PHD/YefM family antitoxin component YafN of YafNO toxin-antitoxin module
MFSSTHLIRQSKQIFDKLQEKEIEKAVILRDGKPSFIMLDFDSYEKVMEEYLLLKEKSLQSKRIKEQIKKQNTLQTIIQQKEQPLKEELPLEVTLDTQKDLQMVPLKSHLTDDVTIDLGEDLEDEHKSEIKEFWDK